MTAISYPENPSVHEKIAMRNFIETVPVILPCDACKQHAIEYLSSIWNKNLNWIVENRNNLFIFWWQFHNHVNKMLNKPLVSFDKAKEIYSFP
jgi:hypothetical protein